RGGTYSSGQISCDFLCGRGAMSLWIPPEKTVVRPAGLSRRGFLRAAGITTLAVAVPGVARLAGPRPIHAILSFPGGDSIVMLAADIEVSNDGVNWSRLISDLRKEPIRVGWARRIS